MHAVRLKVATDAVLKKLVTSLLSISKKMLKTWLRFQFNVVVLPLCFVYGGVKYVYELYKTEEVCALEPKNTVIVSAVKDLRSSVLLGITSISPTKNVETDSEASVGDGIIANYAQSESIAESELLDEENPIHLETGCLSTTDSSNENALTAPLKINVVTGSDLLWDVPIVAQKAKYFAKCLHEGDREKIGAARKALKEYPIKSPIRKTRGEYDRLLKETRNDPIGWEESMFKLNYIQRVRMNNSGRDKCEAPLSNVLDHKQKNKRMSVCLDDTACKSKHKETAKHDGDFQLTTQNKILRHRLAITYRKLEEVHKACSSLLNGISSLNDNFSKFTCMRDKLVILDAELNEGKKLLQEVEADRNVMRSKLMTLEKLIKEEEEFLDDVSCESGFYETENNSDISYVL